MVRAAPRDRPAPRWPRARLGRSRAPSRVQESRRCPEHDPTSRNGFEGGVHRTHSEIRHGGHRPQPFASPLFPWRPAAANRPTSGSNSPSKTTHLFHRQPTLCPRVEASDFPARSRERSTCIPALRCPPPGLRPYLTSSSGWRLRGESDPSGRHNLLSVPIISMIDHHLLRPSTDDSKPGPGRRTHLTHGPLAESPEPFSVAPSSPVCS